MTRTPARVYGALLGLYPRSFRERYGDEMRAFHAARLAEARTGAGRVAIWARVLMDALRHAPAEHLRELSRPPVSPPIPARRESRMNTIAQDVRFGLRSLARRPVFALTVIGTIALGVGANAAIFSVVNGILLRPLPYPNPDRVVSFNHEPPTWLSSDPDFIDYQKNVQSLSSLAAYTQSLVTVTTAGEADRVRAVRVSPEFFATLGSQPVRG
ncbi:MAG TPA: ABC transporter permease, partial [Gemmatimonadaceae bacterium]|nr:ABC transporter permease [Gemmatimonadaceae bacterium]